MVGEHWPVTVPLPPLHNTVGTYRITDSNTVVLEAFLELREVQRSTAIVINYPEYSVAITSKYHGRLPPCFTH